MVQKNFLKKKNGFFLVILIMFFIITSFYVSSEIEFNLNFINKTELEKNEVYNIDVDTNINNKKIINYEHFFDVNLYYPNKTNQEQTNEIKFSEIKIEPIISENEILQCEEANYSFKLTNPSNKKVLYSFKIKNFKGIGYITQNLVIYPKDYKIIILKLVPDCKDIGNLNPFIYIETNKEEALFPLILKINKKEEKINETDNFAENNCQYYYDNSICSSAFYLRLKKNSIYRLDLSNWFYDPDNDKLVFTTNNPENFEIKIKNNIAYIKPFNSWYGAKEIAFTADDSKGGKSTKVFYFHVLNQDLTFWEKITNFFNSLFLIILIN